MRFIQSIGILVIIGLVVWHEVSIWNECRETNSFGTA